MPSNLSHRHLVVTTTRDEIRQRPFQKHLQLSQQRGQHRMTSESNRGTETEAGKPAELWRGKRATNDTQIIYLNMSTILQH